MYIYAYIHLNAQLVDATFILVVYTYVIQYNSI